MAREINRLIYAKKEDGSSRSMLINVHINELGMLKWYTIVYNEYIYIVTYSIVDYG